MSSQASLKSKGRYDCQLTSSQASLKSRARSSQTSLKSRARYTVQAWVPQSAFLSPNLRSKLKNFALKPLTTVSSPRRRQELREEIESSHNNISAADCLWNNNNFAFVAEAKAKTIQLRHRTLELLRKTDDSEALARSLWEEEQPSPEDIQDVYTSAEGGEYLEDDTLEALPGVNFPSKIRSDLAAEGDEDVTTEERERRHNKIKSIRSNMRRRLMNENMMEDEIFKTPKPGDAGERSSDARQDGPLLRRMRTDHLTVQSALLDPDLSEFDEDTGLRGSNKEKSMSPSSRFSPRSGGTSIVNTARSPRMSISQSPRPGSVSSRSAGLSRSGSRTSVLGSTDSRRGFSGSSFAKVGKRRSSFDKSNVLWEDIREISGTSKPCVLKLCGDRSASGFTLEAYIGVRKASTSSLVKRFLPLDEVEELFEWGQMQEKTPSEKYKWLCALVQLTTDDDLVETISLGSWDEHKQEAAKSARMDQLGLSGSFKGLFQTNKERANTKCAEEAAMSEAQLDDFEIRKRSDINSLSAKYSMEVNTAEALSQWYFRIDPEGLGKIDEEEFTESIQKIYHAGQRSYENSYIHQEVRWLMGELHATRENGGHLPFVQFADWLISKFPQVKTMSAYEVIRFSDFAEEANLDSDPRSSVQHNELADMLKRRSEHARSSILKNRSEARVSDKTKSLRRADSTVKEPSRTRS